MKKEEMKLAAEIEVDLRGFNAFGRVLDIGAGGEGVIYRALKRPITGLELSKEEVEELVQKGLADEVEWVIGDARKMPFEDACFDIVTSFFTLMYIKGLENKGQVIKEAARVLRSGGQLHVWDFNIKIDQPIFVGKVKIWLPDSKLIETGYGIGGGEEKNQGFGQIKELVEAHLRVKEARGEREWFYIMAEKPIRMRHLKEGKSLS